MAQASLTEEKITELRNSFRRCSNETVEAILNYRKSGDSRQIPVIVRGIIERYLPAESVEKFKKADDNTRLAEDLGIDSLTMLEIVLSIEEALDMRMDDSQMRQIRTLGDVKGYLAQRASGSGNGAAVASAKKLDRQAVMLSLPQQAPFKFVDEAEIDGDVVRATYKVRGDEYFLEGHFKGNPVFPASIVFEALGQAACLWIMESAAEKCPGTPKPEQVLFASMEGARFFKQTKPGDLLELEQKLVRIRPPMAIFHGTVKNNGEKVAQVDQMMIAFGDASLLHDHAHRAATEPAAAVASV